MVPKANILPRAQGWPCRDRAPDLLLRLHYTYLLPEQPLFGGTPQPAPSFKHLGRLVVSGVLEIHRLHCEKMLTAFPREMQVRMHMAVSPLHAQPLQAWLNKWSWQELSSGGSKVGMESGKFRVPEPSGSGIMRSKYGLEKDTGFCCTAQESRTG